MDPRLLEAAHKGDTIELQKLLSEDQHLLERVSLNESSETILHVACLAGQTEFVKELLKKKADLATRLNQDGFSPIHIASANGFVEIVKELLKVNLELGKLKSSDGRTSLHCAAITGMVPVIKELLEVCPACKDDLTSHGETALHLAVKNNQFEAFKALVDMLKKPDLIKLLNAKDEDGNTVLHLATAQRQSLTLKFLLGGQDIEMGTIDVNVTNKNGLTPLDMLDIEHQMVAHGTDHMVRELLQHAGASRAKELDTVINIGMPHEINPVSAGSTESRQLCQFFPGEVDILHAVKYYRNLAEEVKQSTPETQNALMVVAVLIATVAYQAILQPPGQEVQLYFIVFMVPNSIAFFASLAVIYVLIHRKPLRSLLALALRCMAASYLCGLLLSQEGKKIPRAYYGLLGITVIVLLDFGRFGFRLCRSWYQKLKK